MGFKSLLDTQVQNLMQTLGQTDGLAPEHTYIQVGAGTYDPATATRTPTTTSHTGIPMVLSRFDSKEIDGEQIQVTDQKAIIASLDLPVTPSNEDRVELSTGETYEVVRNMGVPGSSVYILHLRRVE